MITEEEANTVINSICVMYPDWRKNWPTDDSVIAYRDFLMSAYENRNYSSKHAKRAIYWLQEETTDTMPPIGRLLTFSARPTPPEKEEDYKRESEEREKERNRVASITDEDRARNKVRIARLFEAFYTEGK